MDGPTYTYYAKEGGGEIDHGDLPTEETRDDSCGRRQPADFDVSIPPKMSK
jgi:hypothetical protein